MTTPTKENKMIETMTEGDYTKALQLLNECKLHLRRGDYDFAHICILEALTLLGERSEDELDG